MATQNSVNTSLSGQTGTGNFVGSTSPSLVTPALGTPSSGVLTNCTGLPVGTGLATATDSAVLVSGSTGTPVWSATMTNGQIIIGTTSGTPAAATITAGAGITVTNGAGSITIAANSEGTWVNQNTSTVTMAVATGYLINNGATLVTLTLPATSSIGDYVEINGFSAGGWTIAQASSQLIHIGNVVTTTGTGGSLASTNQYDCVRLRCLVANTTWTVVSMQSSGLTYV